MLSLCSVRWRLSVHLPQHTCRGQSTACQSQPSLLACELQKSNPGWWRFHLLSHIVELTWLFLAPRSLAIKVSWLLPSQFSIPGLPRVCCHHPYPAFTMSVHRTSLEDARSQLDIEKRNFQWTPYSFRYGFLMTFKLFLVNESHLGI